MPADTQVDPNATVSVEHDGRVLSGVGVTADQLSETMERHAPPEPTPESTPAPPESAPASGPTLPKQTRGQARFSELTQKAKDAEAREAAAKKELEDYKAQHAQPARQEPPTQTESRQPAPAAAPHYTRPEPTEDEIGTKYQTYAEFTRDQAKWVLEQESQNFQAAIRAGIDADRAQQAFVSHAESIRAKGRTAYKDFDTMLTSGPGVAHANMPQAIIEKIWQHPSAEHVLYAIMRDPATAQKIAHLAVTDPFSLGLELARLAPAQSVVSPASTGLTGSVTPPPPMQPVGSGSSTTSPSSADLIQRAGYDFDKSGYREKRAAELGRSRRR